MFNFFLYLDDIRTCMSELAILQTRVSSISKLSTSLLKCLLKISASYSLLLTVLLLLFKIIDGGKWKNVANLPIWQNSGSQVISQKNALRQSFLQADTTDFGDHS